ncbi:hypothetical protein NA56DRAFT_710973 [Hyaloscypha hepaticicola]|uniref:Uncharacterized protein n=1 Tax=Hyaloscypha hepaticicola TaxID=2082293 RepID=A0A2J6PK18_9HELO|nr:hypothetical protein NA56DRAFT_710973 [Hyaloscypha hepaticicola]
MGTLFIGRLERECLRSCNSADIAGQWADRHIRCRFCTMTASKLSASTDSNPSKPGLLPSATLYPIDHDSLAIYLRLQQPIHWKDKAPGGVSICGDKAIPEACFLEDQKHIYNDDIPERFVEDDGETSSCTPTSFRNGKDKALCVRQAAFHQVSAELPPSIFWWNRYSACNSVEQSPRLLNILNQPWSWPPWTRLSQIGGQNYRRSL